MVHFATNKNNIPTLFNPSILDELFADMDVFGKSTIPYNVEQIRNEDGDLTSTRIEIALAGYDKEDVQIKVVGDKMSVIVDTKEENKDKEYIHKGIHQRSFKLTWTLSGLYDKKNIKGKFNNGLLTINLNILEEEVNTVKIED